MIDRKLSCDKLPLCSTGRAEDNYLHTGLLVPFNKPDMQLQT